MLDAFILFVFSSTARQTSSVASFSSIGQADVSPLLSAAGRTKPDLVAPGLLFIAPLSDGNLGTDNCNLQSIEGTSMSAPAVAAAAVVVYRYLQMGFYPTGTPDAIAAPSAALVKALIISAAQPFSGAGFFHESFPTTPISQLPNIYSGHGLLVLSSVLYFAGQSAHQLFLRDGIPFTSVAASAAVEFCFLVQSSEGPLSFVLSWIDSPAAFPSTTNYSPLNNDIDLLVTLPSGASLPVSADRSNTAEHIRFERCAYALGMYRASMSARVSARFHARRPLRALLSIARATAPVGVAGATR